MNDSIKKYISIAEAASSVKKIPIPYSISSLSPTFSKDLVELHYGTLYSHYISSVNKDPSNKFSFAGAYLHGIYFSQFTDSQKRYSPSGILLKDIKSKFTSFSKFKNEVISACMDVHGSGWIYVSNTLVIKEIPNHEVRDDIFLLIDCWEHAYMLDYKADKKSYYENIWNIFNWEYLEGMYSQ